MSFHDAPTPEDIPREHRSIDVSDAPVTVRCAFCGEPDCEPVKAPWSPICDACRDLHEVEAEANRAARAHPFTPNPDCPYYCVICGASATAFHGGKS